MNSNDEMLNSNEWYQQNSAEAFCLLLATKDYIILGLPINRALLGDKILEFTSKAHTLGGLDTIAIEEDIFL